MDFHVRLARLNERLETLQEGLNGRTAGFPSSFEKLVRSRGERSTLRSSIFFSPQNKAKTASPRPSLQAYADAYKRNQ